MSEQLKIRVDPLNPGQFFACCGLFDLLTRNSPELLAWFEVHEQSPRQAQFVLSGADEQAVQGTIRELRLSEYKGLDHPEKTVKPVLARFGKDALELDWWLDEFREEATSLKCWAGQVTSIRLFEELAPLVDVTFRIRPLCDAQREFCSRCG